MNLKELKEQVDFLMKHYEKEAEELEVAIRLSDPSIGGSAFTKVHSIHKGIDWEGFRININPSEPIIRKTNKRQIKINDEESAFVKELNDTLIKYQPERQSKLILEVHRVIRKHHQKKKK